MFEKVQLKAPTVCGGAPEKYTLDLFGFPFSDPSWGFPQILPDWLRDQGSLDPHPPFSMADQEIPRNSHEEKN